VILSFHCAHDLVKCLRGGRDELWDADSPLNATRREARHASSEETRAHEDRESDSHATGRVAKTRGTEGSPRSTSYGEGEVESRATLPPLSHLSPPPSRTTPSPHQEVVPLQMRSMSGECRLKHPLAEGGPPTDTSRQLLPTMVTPDHEGQQDPSVGTSRGKLGLTPIPEIQHVVEAPTTASPSSLGEAGPPLKKVFTKGCLSPSARYAHMG
jgi:hypothetical protein